MKRMAIPGRQHGWSSTLPTANTLQYRLFRFPGQSPCVWRVVSACSISASDPGLKWTGLPRVQSFELQACSPGRLLPARCSPPYCSIAAWTAAPFPVWATCTSIATGTDNGGRPRVGNRIGAFHGSQPTRGTSASNSGDNCPFFHGNIAKLTKYTQYCVYRCRGVAYSRLQQHHPTPGGAGCPSKPQER